MLDPISLVMGLLGGGGGSMQTTTTQNSTLAAAVSPNIQIVIDEATASSGLDASLNAEGGATSNAAQTDQDTNPLAGFGLGGTATAVPVQSAGISGSTKIIALVAVVGAGAYFLLRA